MKRLLTALLALLALSSVPSAAVEPGHYGCYEVYTRTEGYFQWQIAAPCPAGYMVRGPWVNCATAGGAWISSALPYQAPNGAWLRVRPSMLPGVGLQQLMWIPLLGPMWIGLTSGRLMDPLDDLYMMPVPGWLLRLGPVWLALPTRRP
jgi:hypothetical protein